MKTIMILPLDKLLPASWNYKTEGTEEQIQKLMESIKHDASAGVPAVREMEGGMYEVIDGNHRLSALKRLGWPEVQVENFGAISKATAVLISRRRNHQWFDDDMLKLAELFRTDVAKEFTTEELASFMPETKEELDALTKLLDFNWNQFDRPAGEEPPEDEEGFKTLKILLRQDVWDLWQEWIQRVKSQIQAECADSTAFEYAVAEALGRPLPTPDTPPEVKKKKAKKKSPAPTKTKSTGSQLRARTPLDKGATI